MKPKKKKTHNLTIWLNKIIIIKNVFFFDLKFKKKKLLRLRRGSRFLRSLFITRYVRERFPSLKIPSPKLPF